MTSPRIRPLTAQRSAVEPLPDPAFAAETPADDDHESQSRFDRLKDSVRNLRIGGRSLRFGERTLMILGGIIAPLGLVMIFVGWWGAAHSPYQFQQTPYLISGGLLGLGFVFLGSFFYFAHWMTELVKEHRQQSAVMVEAIARLEATVRQQGAASSNGHGNGHPAGPEPSDERVLVATGRGTMAHRPECIVVTGKSDLRQVTASDGLESCRLCDPYA